MRFEIDWLDSAPNAAAEERATACDLRVWVGDVNVTEHLVAGRREANDHVTIAAYALAEGMAHDWWTIFGSRDQRYHLRRHRSGFALPDIALQFNGRQMEITTEQRPYGNPPVRFWQAPTTIVTRREAEQGLESFIDQTIDRLDAVGIAETGAQLRWSRVSETRQDPDEQLYCECAGALGLDPYDLDDASAGVIERAAALFDGEPLIELLAGLRAVADRRQALDWIAQAEERPINESRLPLLAELADDVANDAAARDGERAFELGYRRARALRRRLEMGTGARVRSVADFARKLHARDFTATGRAHGLRAVVRREGTEAAVNLSNTPHESSMLFSLGRAIGQLVCFPETTRSPVNDLVSAFDQAAGRAFAAEFLAPIDEIRNLISDGRNEEEIAAELNVSDHVIARQIENAGRIEAACANAA